MIAAIRSSPLLPMSRTIVRRSLWTVTNHHHLNMSSPRSWSNQSNHPSATITSRATAKASTSTATGVRLLGTSPGSKAFGDSDKYQKVIHDLFLSYARPRNESSPDPSEAADTTPCLDISNLRNLLCSIGEKPSEESLQILINLVDTDGNGTIELDEFLDGCDHILSSTSNKTTQQQHDDDEEAGVIDLDDLIKTFQTLDKDGSGELTKSELEGLLSTTGGHLKASDAEEIFQLADTNGDGKIDWEEFLQFVTDPKSSRYAWRLKSGFRVLLVIGGPGSGKGELCSRLIERAGVHHYSSGEMLREEVASGSSLGKSIEGLLQKGELVPSTTMIALLKKQIGQFPGALVALDGFPRTPENYQDFDEICGPPECAIYIDLPDEVMIERIANRAASSEITRADDNIETARTRIQTFHDLTIPTLNCLKESNVPIYTINGMDSREGVWMQLIQHDTAILRRLAMDGPEHDPTTPASS